MKSQALSLAFFLVCVLGAGLGIGYLNMPGDWYAGLPKPAFNPPNWIFGPVWSAIYVLIAIAGWRTWAREGYGTAFMIWLLQMAVNFLWPIVFFSLHLIAVALALIVALLGLILSFVGYRWRADRISSILFLPYAAWVAFAAGLNAEIVRLN